MRKLFAKIAMSCALVPALLAGMSEAAVNLPVHKEVYNAAV